MVVIFHCRIVILLQHFILNQLMDRIQRQIRIHGAGAVSQQRREMVNLAGLS